MGHWYLTLQRPPMIGGWPHGCKVKEIFTFAEPIRTEYGTAWGVIVVEEVMKSGEAAQYDLMYLGEKR